MEVSDQQRGWLDGDGGPSLQWATAFNEGLGDFFEAPRMVPVSSAHFAPDSRMMGEVGKALLQWLVDDGAWVRVPSYLDPCMVDLAREAELVASYGLSNEFVARDRAVFGLARKLGFLPTHTCINYQTISPPRFGEHLAWGDTGTAIVANGIFGARTNFEGGPSALASALAGCTPRYGFHCAENRRGNLIVRIDCQPAEIADWGAIAIWAGQLATGYDTVPVFHGDFAPPTFNMLKQLGVALASHGGHAMFHVVGATPEAPSLEAACGGRVPSTEHVCTKADLEAVYEHSSFRQGAVDLVVFAAPQLSIDEVGEIVAGLDGRRVHGNTKLIMAVDPQVRAQADNAGITNTMDELGAGFTTGTCFYPEAPLMREATGWRTVVTNSAKLVNALASAGYETALRRLDRCLDAATTGRL
jgi:predicted aconitase